MGNILPPESYWKLGTASHLLSKIKWAAFQTGDLGRKKTIISVDNDMTFVLENAVEEYLEKHRREYQ